MGTAEEIADLSKCITLDEVAEAARERLDENALAYYESGADDEITMGLNRSAYSKILLHYRVLVGVSFRDTSTTALGVSIASPILIAPIAFQKMAHPDGEAATARAAAANQTVMILSTLSNTDVEDVVAAGGGPVWFQLYVYRDREATRALVQRAEAAGCRAIVLTVDAPVIGRRRRDVRNQFHLPDGLSVRNLHGAGLADLRKQPGDSGLAGYFAGLLDSGLTWDDVTWLQSITHLPIVIKGIIRADDAQRAVQSGAAAIIVSNHGGRQLDTAPPTIDVLPPVVEAVAGKAEVYIDGGIRRGTDVLKAVALGARAVLLGRPVLWGLAVGGQRGVQHVLQLLHDEFDRAMALSGCPTVEDITRDLIFPDE